MESHRRPKPHRGLERRGWLALSAQEAYRAFVDLAEQRVRTNLECLGDLARRRTLQDMASVQTRFMRQNLEMTVDAARKLADATDAESPR